MADVEVALMEFFDDLAYTVTSTPPDLEARLAAGGRVLRVKRIGGGSNSGDDNPIMSLQSFAPSEPPEDDNRDPDEVYVRPVMALNQAVEDLLLGLQDSGPTLVAGTVLEDPEKTSGPVELLWPNPDVSVVESIYRLTTRR